MNGLQLLESLRAQGVHLDADRDRLHVEGPEHVVTDDLIAIIAAQKDELLDLLRGGESSPDPFVAWRSRNRRMLADQDGQLGRDPSGCRVRHGRWLSYPEQVRGACSWCVPVDPKREPEYWDSHWRHYGIRGISSGPGP